MGTRAQESHRTDPLRLAQTKRSFSCTVSPGVRPIVLTIRPALN
jgi:hypothetical protein